MEKIRRSFDINPKARNYKLETVKQISEGRISEIIPLTLLPSQMVCVAETSADQSEEILSLKTKRTNFI